MIKLKKVEELEKEEALREEAGYYAVPKIEIDETLREIKELAQKIRDRKIINRNESRITRQSNKPVIPRTAPSQARGRSAMDFRNRMEDLGVDMEDTEKVLIYYNKVLSKIYLKNISNFLGSFYKNSWSCSFIISFKISVTNKS